MGMPYASGSIHLAILSVFAPFVACGLGYIFTHLIDRAIPSAQKHAGRESWLESCDSGHGWKRSEG